MEFQPNLLSKKGTEPKFLLNVFENNGYKISEKDFLSKNYASIDELLKKDITNIYLVYKTTHCLFNNKINIINITTFFYPK